MKIDWANWNHGAKIIFVAACLGILSMLMDWVSIGFASQNGISQGAFLFLALWVYPVTMLLKAKPIRQAWGLALACSSVIFTGIYIGSKSIEIFGKHVNAAASGAWLFLFVSIALIVGILKYVPAERS